MGTGLFGQSDGKDEVVEEAPTKAEEPVAEVEDDAEE